MRFRGRSFIVIGALGALGALAGAASAKPADPCAGLTPEACDRAAFGLDHGIDLQGKKVKRDEPRAVAMYRAACEAKLAAGCSDLAAMGARAGLDDAGVIRWYRAACELGAADGCFLLAAELKESDAPADRAEALGRFEAQCGAGRADACHQRADMAEGAGDRATWYGKACDAGVGDSCVEIARMYLRDAYPGADAAASTRALEKMCDAGVATACDFAGQRHFEGKGARASRKDADVWITKACERGALELCVARGRSMFLDGQRAAALHLLTVACDGGDTDGCEWLARAKAAPAR